MSDDAAVEQERVDEVTRGLASVTQLVIELISDLRRDRTAAVDAAIRLDDENRELHCRVEDLEGHVEVLGGELARARGELDAVRNERATWRARAGCACGGTA